MSKALRKFILCAICLGALSACTREQVSLQLNPIVPLQVRQKPTPPPQREPAQPPGDAATQVRFVCGGRNSGLLGFGTTQMSPFQALPAIEVRLPIAGKTVLAGSLHFPWLMKANAQGAEVLVQTVLEKKRYLLRGQVNWQTAAQNLSVVAEWSNSPTSAESLLMGWDLESSPALWLPGVREVIHPGAGNFKVLDLDSNSIVEEIPIHPAKLSMPVANPSGSWLVFHSTSQDGRLRLQIYDRSSKELRELTALSKDHDQISPAITQDDFLFWYERNPFSPGQVSVRGQRLTDRRPPLDVFQASVSTLPSRLHAFSEQNLQQVGLQSEDQLIWLAVDGTTRSVHQSFVRMPFSAQARDLFWLAPNKTWYFSRRHFGGVYSFEALLQKWDEHGLAKDTTNNCPSPSWILEEPGP